MRGRARHQRGMSLIEVVIAIVVIAIAIGGVLSVLAGGVSRSADAMIVSQGVAIAEAYLEEISLRPFSDPDGVDDETARAGFDDIDDYDGLVDTGAVDQFGNAIAGLGRYTVSVDVSVSPGLPGVGAADAYRIDVRVQYAPALDYTLSAYRTRL